MRLPNQIVPIYIVSGFLDSGKTSIIHNMLEDDGFSRGQKTLIVVCEEGVEEFDEAALAKQNAQLYIVDSVDDMTSSLFVDLNKQYKPERVIIEYNSVFTFAKLNTMQLPAAWELVQVICTVDAKTYENYMVNMRQLMTDPMQNSDLILFNRCENDMPISTWRRQMRALNNNCTILFYLDAMEHPDRYDRKTLRFKGQAFKDSSLPKDFVRFGRYAMTCCADDIACLAFVMRGDVKPSDSKYYTLTCRSESVYNKAQDHDMVALMQVSVEPCAAPKDKYVTFG